MDYMSLSVARTLRDGWDMCGHGICQRAVDKFKSEASVRVICTVGVSFPAGVCVP